MNFLDYIIISIIIIGFILGYKDGLVRKIIGLIGFILAIGLSFEFSKPFGLLLTPIFNGEKNLAEIIGGILIFIFVIFVFAVLKRIIHPVDKVNRFVNQILGGISGVIQMVFFISAFLLFLSIFNFPSNAARSSSILYEDVYEVLPKTIDFVLGKNSKAKKFIENYINREDKFSLPQNNKLKQ